MHVRFESREDIVVVLDVRRFLLRVGGGVIGLVRDREILQKEGRSLPVVIDEAEIEHAAVHDHVEHVDRDLVARALELENDVVVDGLDRLVGLGAERFDIRGKYG